MREFLPRLARRSMAEFLDDHCAQYASSIAYHVLFSLFPLAIVLAGVFGIVVRATGSQADVVDTIVRNVPLSPSGDRQLRTLLTGATGNLSALGLIGIVGMVYAASGMMASIRLALNAAWDVDESRPFLRGKLVDIALVFGAAGLALASLALTVGLRTIGSLGGLGNGLAIVAPLLTAFGVVVLLYRIVPAADVQLGDAVPGALLVACIFVVLENLFAIYVQHFAHYNAVYGSLGAVIAFMFFVYLSSLAFLFGAEVASEWPRVRENERVDRSPTPGEEPTFTEQLVRVVKSLWVRDPAD